jgi:hypothetical protein
MKKTTTAPGFHLRAINIIREGSYYGSHQPVDPSRPFRTTVEVQGATGKVELNLAPELSRKIVELIADEIAAAGRMTADIMVADALIYQAPTAKAIEGATA